MASDAHRQAKQAGGSLLGRDLGNYTIRSVLGHGGMATVFAGHHRFLGDRVAIKILHGTYADNPKIAQRFFQEAKAARDIKHPSIVKILDFGQSEEGGLYLVMELLEGRSLSAILDDGPLSEEETAYIAAQLADGLAAAHQQGIIHRDLKPDNIYLCGDRVKLLDFGIAKVLSASGHTGTDALLGTPRYMAPEQAKGAKFVGPHSDIYSLGVILYKMMTGRTPFDGDATELLAKTLFEKPPAPSSMVKLSPQMEQLIMQCLEKEPEGRPASMIEVRDRLLHEMGAEQLGALRPSPTAQMFAVTARDGEISARLASPTPVSGASEPFSTELITRARLRRLRWVGAAAGAVLILGTVAAVLLLRARPTAPVAVPAPAPVAVKTAPPTPVPPRPTAPRKAQVVVRTVPPGAKLRIGKDSVGVSPAVLSLTLPQEIHATLDGFQPTHEVVSQEGEIVIRLARERKLAPRPGPGRSEPAKSPSGEGLD